MRSTYLLILLALLMPLALSAPASNTHSGGVVIDVQSPSSQNAPNEVTKAPEYVFVGSIKSDKYHYPSCNAAKKIKPENEIWFTSSADARAHGYVPCGDLQSTVKIVVAILKMTSFSQSPRDISLR